MTQEERNREVERRSGRIKKGAKMFLQELLKNVIKVNIFSK